VTADRKDGKKTVWMDDAQSILHVAHELIKDVLNQRGLMKKDQLKTVEKRLDEIRKTVGKD
jgi:hypothetical protein